MKHLVVLVVVWLGAVSEGGAKSYRLSEGRCASSDVLSSSSDCEKSVSRNTAMCSKRDVFKFSDFNAPKGCFCSEGTLGDTLKFNTRDSVHQNLGACTESNVCICETDKYYQFESEVKNAGSCAIPVETKQNCEEARHVLDGPGEMCGTKGAIAVYTVSAPVGCFCFAKTLYFNSGSETAGGTGNSNSTLRGECSEIAPCLCGSGASTSIEITIVGMVLGIVFPLLCISGLAVFCIGRRRSRINTKRMQQMPGHPNVANAHTIGQEPGQRMVAQMRPQYAQPIGTGVGNRQAQPYMQQGVGQRAMMMNGGQQIQYTNQAQFGVQQVQYVNPGQQVQMVALQPGQQIQMANHGQPVVLRPPHAQPAIMQTRPQQMVAVQQQQQAHKVI